MSVVSAIMAAAEANAGTAAIADLVYAQAVEKIRFFLSTIYDPVRGPVTEFKILEPILVPGVVQGSSAVHLSIVLSETAATVPFFFPTILAGYRFLPIDSYLSWLVNGIKHNYVGVSGQDANLVPILQNYYLGTQAYYVGEGKQIDVTPKFNLGGLDTLTGGASAGHYKTLTLELVAIVKCD
jgi:hypothetical protein